jgi:pilus assembly protein Flp/PilA
MQPPHVVAVLMGLANRKFTRDEDGQDLVEYGLLVALIAIIAIAAVSSVGQTINNVFWQSIAANF